MPLPNPYLIPFTIDGREAVLSIARLDAIEATRFRAEFRLFREKASRVARLKEAAATDTEFDAQVARELLVEEEGAQFFSRVIRDYVGVESGLIDDVGEKISTGSQFLETYGSQIAVLREVVSAIYIENSVSAATKQARRAARGVSPVTGADPATTEARAHE